MIVPVRCFSCGKPVGHVWQEFRKLVDEEKKTVKEALDKLELKRFCCRSAVMSHVDSIDIVGKYK